ncbi:HD domain-containing phosphohydrolase [Chloroflexota bacterium]
MVTLKENILIVDDEEIIRWVLRRKLTKEGYQCEEANDGEQAVSKLKAKPSELVVLDINMPGKPGSELLPEIRTDFPETAVIMASGVTDTKVIAQCIKDGAQDYIQKPFKLEEILLSVGRSLEKRRLELQIMEYQKNLGGKVKEQQLEMRRLFLGAIETLVFTLEASDQYTAGHSRAVTDIALNIGRKLNLSTRQMGDLQWGSLLHDVGKIAVDPRILNKPGELNPNEYRHIMTHAIVGPALVRPLVCEKVVSIIAHHHDRYDGRGLDQNISGEDIPMEARIVTVADAFNAMISDRPYRAAMSNTEALDEVKANSGTQFDPAVAEALAEIVDDAPVPMIIE